MNLYIITDLRYNDTATVVMDAETYYKCLQSIRKENRKEYRYEIEAVETNKALRP